MLVKDKNGVPTEKELIEEWLRLSFLNVDEKLKTEASKQEIA